MLSWLVNNKEWFFSGIGVLILSTVIGFFIKQKASIIQKQKSGDNGINIQSAGSLSMSNSFNDNDKNDEGDENEYVQN
ncbi:hypothetical protein AXY43_24875 [Clostridium sp. MF28]|uniref:hypothetical protein n=1 Tax=Clostridium TaxID=1485 RepID=UPI0002F3B532|nr:MULTISPECIES: hypothetical protein [Clostridium]AVK50992.1 hypothetical protein AXY43_24875 [Clostridium sp. MF28]OVE66207.1 hypothetical protein CCS79_19010 [Clostridium diolis]PSM55617.1 hypothetical protein C4L39_21930 [Clostridium diolis]